MPIPEISELDKTVNQLIADGANSSASRLISDTVADLVLRCYAIETNIRFVVHYTSIDALLSILSCPIQHDSYFPLTNNRSLEELDSHSAFLRIYDSYNFNDPNEGRFFINAAPPNHPLKTKHPNLWQLLLSRSERPAYISSFSGVPKVEEADNLIFWRTYGNEGKGCAIVFPVSFFGNDTPVYQVEYGRGSVKSVLDNLSNVFDSLETAKSLLKHSLLPASSSIPGYVSSSLSPIPFLHKEDPYKFENEVRVVVPFNELPQRSLFCHCIHDSKFGLKLRHFANMPALHINNIFRTESEILLGPAVSSTPNLIFVLKQRLQSFNLSGTKIHASKIDYQT